MKKRIVFIAILFLVLAGSAYAYTRMNKAKEVHYHAGFVLYVDGKKQDLSADQYMHVELCETDESGSDDGGQIERAHLHNNIGDVAHIHRDDARWKDLLDNLKIDTRGKTVNGFMGGQEVTDILGRHIAANDSVILSVGDSSSVDRNSYVTRDRIIEAESKTESC